MMGLRLGNSLLKLLKLLSFITITSKKKKKTSKWDVSDGINSI